MTQRVFLRAPLCRRQTFPKLLAAARGTAAATTVATSAAGGTPSGTEGGSASPSDDEEGGGGGGDDDDVYMTQATGSGGDGGGCVGGCASTGTSSCGKGGGSGSGGASERVPALLALLRVVRGVPHEALSQQLGMVVSAVVQALKTDYPPLQTEALETFQVSRRDAAGIVDRRRVHPALRRERTSRGDPSARRDGCTQAERRSVWCGRLPFPRRDRRVSATNARAPLGCYLRATWMTPWSVSASVEVPRALLGVDHPARELSLAPVERCAEAVHGSRQPRQGLETSCARPIDAFEVDRCLWAASRQQGPQQ